MTSLKFTRTGAILFSALKTLKNSELLTTELIHLSMPKVGNQSVHNAISQFVKNGWMFKRCRGVYGITGEMMEYLND
jgi:predicted transcriptional regulator